MQYISVLASGQGMGKSTFLSHILPPEMNNALRLYASSLRIDENPAELSRRIRGTVLGEFSEMSGADKASNKNFKDWITSNEDTHRRLYEEFYRSYPRRTVPVGSVRRG